MLFRSQLARQPGGKVNLGDQEFSLGNDVVFAQTVAKRGPLIFAPLSGHVTLFVQHLGTKPAEGWLAFDAHVEGQPADCFVKWRPATVDFVDQPAVGVKGVQCAPMVFPADGTGLEHFATRVSSNQVVINLRQPIGTSPATSATTAATTAAPATTTTVATGSAPTASEAPG